MAVSSASQQTSEILLLLGRVDGKLDAVISSTADDRRTTEKLSERVRVIEQGQTRIMAYASCVGAIAGALVSFISIHWKVAF